MKNRAFTLVELLVVVLIIGILAAIAVPQYQKAVMKANLHKGIPLVESLYQAQQAYYLANGDFATDIDDLDLTIPKDESCKKTQTTATSYYSCSFGIIGMWNNFTNMQYITTNGSLAYLHFLRDLPDHSMKEGEVWCFAKPNNTNAQGVCLSEGGSLQDENAYWKLYKIR